MCSDDQHNELLAHIHQLHEHIRHLYQAIISQEKRPFIDLMKQVSATAAYLVDYRERRHIFIWLPTTQLLSFEDFGQGTVPAQQWVNLGLPPGVRVFAPNVTSGTVPIFIRCTDETLP